VAQCLNPEVRWERMFPDELEAAFAACPVAWLPYGLCEPHGPHNAVGLDGLKAHAVCVRAAQAGGGIVAPLDLWHIHEIGGYAVWAARMVGEARPWLTAMPPWQHFKNVAYHLRAVAAMGFEAAILLTGHYGPNWQDLNTLVALLQPHLATRLYALPDFECNQPGYDGAGGDHAGKVETSLLWALEPDCVDVSRLPAEGDESGAPWFAMGRDARLADRRVGQRMVEDEVRWLLAKAAELRAEYGDRQPTVLSFHEVEDIWREVVEPALPSFLTMRDAWDEGAVPPTSRWHTNWRVAR